MTGSGIAVVVLLVLGGGVACAVYEVMVRKFAPPRTGRAAAGEASAGNRPQPPHEGAGAQGEEAGASCRAAGRAHDTGGRRRGWKSALRGRSEARSGAPRPGVGVHGASGDARTRFLGAATRCVERLLPMASADGEAYRAEIARAGWGIEPETWRVLRIVAAAGCGAMAGVGAMASGAAPPASGTAVGMAAVVGWTVPRFAIARAADRRRRAIEAQLPDAMELLGIAIAAGSPVEQCFREVAQNLRPPLSGEFEAVDREVNLLGHSARAGARPSGGAVREPGRLGVRRPARPGGEPGLLHRRGPVVPGGPRPRDGAGGGPRTYPQDADQTGRGAVVLLPAAHHRARRRADGSGPAGVSEANTLQ